MRFYMMNHSDRHVFVEAEVAVPDFLELEEGRRYAKEIGLWGSIISVETREELQARSTGRRALLAWESGDDSELTRDTRTWKALSDRADVEMRARQGSREAMDLLSRKASDEEMATWLREDAMRDEPKLRAVD